VAGESWGTVVAFTIPSTIVLGVLGYAHEPREKTDADRMSWLFSIVFRSIGRR
jgi:hypothetical protein